MLPDTRSFPIPVSTVGFLCRIDFYTVGFAEVWFCRCFGAIGTFVSREVWRGGMGFCGLKFLEYQMKFLDAHTCKDAKNMSMYIYIQLHSCIYCICICIYIYIYHRQANAHAPHIHLEVYNYSYTQCAQKDCRLGPKL